MKRGKKELQIIKFGDMEPGTHFVDAYDRKFIKLKLEGCTGLKFSAVRHWDGETRSFLDTFNAVDYHGICGKCPEWCTFEIIEPLT